MRRTRAVLAAVLAFLVVGGATLVSAALAGQPGEERIRTFGLEMAGPPHAGPAAGPGAGYTVTAEPPPEVTVEVDGFLAWALRDRITGDTVASANATETSSTESMIKTWLVADRLRRIAERGREPGSEVLRDARLAIRDSHNAAAQRLYVAGGQDAVVRRMIKICGLADTHIPEGSSGWWSRTEMSAIDAVRLGACLADGTAAGPEWTDWLLEQMRNVRGTTAAKDQRTAENFEGGRWGIIHGLPPHLAEQAAIKNGWTRIGRDSSWHLNCLAITDGWVMAVMMRYPAEYPLDYGAQRCAHVARQLVRDDSPLPEMSLRAR